MTSSLSSGQNSRIAEFWRAFLKQEAAWQSLTVREKFDAINAFSKQYYPALAFEVFDFGQPEGITGLCITANGTVEEFPALMELVHAAPALAHYQIQAFRSRTKKDGASFNMEMDGLELRPSDILIGYYPDGQRAGLEIRFAPDIPPQQEKTAHMMAFIMLDHFIGEYDFAVKVGPVNFVEAWSDRALGPTPLDRFPPQFDRFWAEELGHTALFPASNDQKWRMLEVFQNSDSTRAGGPKEKSLVSVNLNARTVAMRADLSLAMTLTVRAFDMDERDFAQEKQDHIAEIIEHRQIGILALTMLKKGYRHAVYYVSGRDEVQKLIEQTMGSNAFDLQAEHDFKWSKYRYFADLP